jgi:hypothetical protein
MLTMHHAGHRGRFAILFLSAGCSSFDVDSRATDGGPPDGLTPIVIPDGSVSKDADAGVSSQDAHVADVGHPSDSTAPDDGDATADAAASCDGGLCGIETVATGFFQAGVLGLDDTNVYVEDQGGTTGTVYQCRKTGCSSLTTLGPGYATGIGVDTDNVYWNDFAGGAIVSCKIGGCANAPTIIAPTQPSAEGLSYDGTNLFWAASGNIVTCLAPSCASRTTLVMGQSQTITSVASFAGSAYWLSSGSVLACSAGGCGSSPTSVTSDSASGSLVVKNGFVYFTSGNSIVSCPVTSACAFPHTIGSSYVPFGLGTDGVDIYWLDDEIAQVFRCPVTGCIGSAEVFADQTAIDPSGEIGANVVTDGEYAYWADAMSVYRKHK